MQLFKYLRSVAQDEFMVQNKQPLRHYYYYSRAIGVLGIRVFGVLIGQQLSFIGPLLSIAALNYCEFQNKYKFD